MRARSELIALLRQLLETQERTPTAQELGRWAGAADLIIFTRDPELGVLLPAPGFRRTLRPGSAWRSFLAAAALRPRVFGELPGPDGESQPAAGFRAADGSLLVLLGGTPDHGALTELVELFPLISGALQVEATARIATTNATLETRAAELARALAVELDAARRELEDSRTRLVAANRTKDQFFAMLGHELRNPLAPIVTALGTDATTKRVGVPERAGDHRAPSPTHGSTHRGSARRVTDCTWQGAVATASGRDRAGRDQFNRDGHPAHRAEQAHPGG